VLHASRNARRPPPRLRVLEDFAVIFKIFDLSLITAFHFDADDTLFVNYYAIALFTFRYYYYDFRAFA